jgi:hypothetical protein
MKRALIVLTVIFATACKGKDIVAPVTSTNGTLKFEIETRTCSLEPPLDVEVFVDHVLVGTPTLTVGSTVSYQVVGGSHTVGGFAVNGKYNWGFVTVNVPAGGEYTASFSCQ